MKNYSCALFLLNLIFLPWRVFSVTDCQVSGNSLRSTGFIFVEISESAELGEILCKINRNDIQDIKFLTSDYPVQYLDIVKHHNEIHITLLRSLNDYFLSNWVSNFESVLEVTYPSGIRNATFLTAIQDVNNNAPVFYIEIFGTNAMAVDPLELHVQLPWPPDVSLTQHPQLAARARDNKGPFQITVVDYDFDDSNAAVSIACENQKNESEDCDSFSFVLISAAFSRENPGHRFHVDVYVNSSIGLQDRVYELYLVASDLLSTTKHPLQITTRAEVISDEHTKVPVVPIVAAGGAALFLMIVISGFLGVTISKAKKTKKILDKLTKDEIREFRKGANMPRGSVVLNASIAIQPFKKDYELPRENLLINETCILGSGAFGVVYKGNVLKDNVPQEVAVKMLKRSTKNTVQYFKALLDELKIMAYIGHHPNVVKLIGSCSKNIKKLELYIAVEFCLHGNIRDFLKYRRTQFSNMVSDGVLISSSLMGSLARQNMFQTSISTLDLIDWSQQVANGMDFLSSKQVIHGDLAARNILIDSERIAKISDFGLSRRLVDYTNYSKKSHTPLPLRWMAPESLKFKRFSTKSDVWSYGILLWEIFSLGQEPYPGVPNDETFVDRLDDGLRMSRPENATTEIYEVMKKCWGDPDYNRPLFVDIKNWLHSMQAKHLEQQGDGYLSLGFMSGLNAAYTASRNTNENRLRNTHTSVFNVISEEDCPLPQAKHNERHTIGGVAVLY